MENNNENDNKNKERANYLSKIKNSFNHREKPSVKSADEIAKERWKFNELGDRFNLVEKFYSSSARYNWAKNSGREYEEKAFVLSDADFDQSKSQPTLSSIIPLYHEVRKVEDDLSASMQKARDLQLLKNKSEIPSPPSGLLSRIRKNFFQEDGESAEDTEEMKKLLVIETSAKVENVEIVAKIEQTSTEQTPVELARKFVPRENSDPKIREAILEMQRARKKKATGKFNLSKIQPSL